jgi:hypothetical protein
MRTLLTAAAFLLLAPALASAQGSETPKPSPEVQKLGYYIGSWKGQGETKAGPFGKAGKLSSETKCEWFEGGHQVVCRGHEMGPTGKRGFLNILSYDESAKSFTEYSVSSFGEAEYDTGGSIAGNKVTYLVDGKSAKFRYTETRLSPDLYTYRAEASVGGKPWAAIAEGKITRVK